MIADRFVKELNVPTDPWGFSNESLGVIFSILYDMDSPKVLCLGASNASALMAATTDIGNMLILEEHPAIAAYVENLIGETESLKIQETVSVSHDGFSCYEYQVPEDFHDADVILVEGPRNSSFGRALQLRHQLKGRDYWVFWANAHNPMVIKAIELFEKDAGASTITSFMKDTREGLAITRVFADPIF